MSRGVAGVVSAAGATAAAGAAAAAYTTLRRGARSAGALCRVSVACAFDPGQVALGATSAGMVKMQRPLWAHHGIEAQM